MIITEEMIEAGCRERCRQERLNPDSKVYYVTSEASTHNHFAAEQIPEHLIGKPGRNGQLITQHESMPLWRWRFYNSVKQELEAAVKVIR